MQDRAHTPADNALNALLGRGSEFDGKLNFEGTVRIDGTFTGEIGTNDMLIIGEGAKVTADITCGSIVINGEVTGNIKATEMVELHKPAKVKGDITTPSLMIDKGVTFNSRFKASIMLDIYNVLNADSVTNFNLNVTSPRNVIAVLDPRVFQLGFRFEF